MPFTRAVWLRVATTLIAAGAAAGLSISAYGGWSTGDAQDSGIQTGIVDLSMTGEYGTATLGTPFGTAEAPVGPNTRQARFLTLVNRGDGPYIDLMNVRLHAGVTVTGDTNTAYPDTVPATDEEVSDDLHLQIDACTQPWQGSDIDATCPTGTVDAISSLAADFPLAELVGVAKAKTLTLSANRAAGTLPRDTNVYLKFSCSLPSIANLHGSTAGAAFLVVWTFSADQRAGRDDTPA